MEVMSLHGDGDFLEIAWPNKPKLRNLVTTRGAALTTSAAPCSSERPWPPS